MARHLEPLGEGVAPLPLASVRSSPLGLLTTRGPRVLFVPEALSTAWDPAARGRSRGTDGGARRVRRARRTESFQANRRVAPVTFAEEAAPRYHEIARSIERADRPLAVGARWELSQRRGGGSLA